MATAHRPARQGRPGLRAALAALATALLLVAAPAGLEPVSARFSTVTANVANSLAADRLQPPTGLGVTQSCTVTPAITHRTPTTNTGSLSITLPLPTGTTTGDVLVAHVAYRFGAVTVTAPSGWTRLIENTSGTQVTSAVYWKTATSTETAATFTRASGSGDMAGGLIAFTGAHPTAPVVTYGGTTGTGTTASTPSLSTGTQSTVEVVHFLTKRQEDLPPPGGTTSLYQGMSGTGTGTEGLTGSDETFTGPGTVPSRTSTSSAGFNAEWIAQSVVLRRAAGTPSADLSWTASTSSAWATGYELTRTTSGTAQAPRTVSGGTTTSATEGPLVDGTAYGFQLTTVRGTWRSTPVSVPFTPAC